MAEATVTGLEEVLSQFKQLDAKLQQKSFKAATKAGSKIIESVMRGDAPGDALKGNIKSKSSSKSSKGVFKTSVGYFQDKWNGGDYFATFYIWGHKTGSATEKTGTRKDVPGNDFVRKAASDSGQTAVNAIVEAIKKAIEE